MTASPIDYDSFIGQSFGKWTVVGYESVPRKDRPHRPNQSRISLRCVCSCGVEKLKRKYDLLSGTSTKCGKCRYECRRLDNRQTNAYKSWECMKQRCDNPNSDNYSIYGGRGVTYCERWKSFDNFFEDMGDRPDGYQLDKDKKGGVGCKLYCPENCSWLTPEDNFKYRRISSQSLPPERVDIIIGLINDGHTNHAIKQIMGHSWDTIDKLRKRHTPDW